MFVPVRYHLKDVIVGKIYFLLVRIKIQHMELQLIKKEITGIGAAPSSRSRLSISVIIQSLQQCLSCCDLQVQARQQKRKRLQSTRSWTELQSRENQFPSGCSWLVTLHSIVLLASLCTSSLGPLSLTRSRLLFARIWLDTHHERRQQEVLCPLLSQSGAGRRRRQEIF